MRSEKESIISAHPSTDQKYSFYFSIEGFDQAKEIDPASAFIAVFIGSIPKIGLFHQSRQIARNNGFDVFPGRVIDHQAVGPWISGVVDKNGDGIGWGEDVL